MDLNLNTLTLNGQTYVPNGGAVYGSVLYTPQALTDEQRSQARRNIGAASAFYETYVTPQMYGAVGDGVTDDKDAFQKCMDAAVETGAPVFIPAGDYTIGGMLTIGSGVRITGAGRDVTKLHRTAADRNCTLYIPSAESVYLSDFAVIDDVTSGAPGILVNGNSRNIILERLFVTGFGSNINIVGDRTANNNTNTVDPGTVEKVVVRDCEVSDATNGYGIVFNCTNNAVVENINAHDNYLDGIKTRLNTRMITVNGGVSYDNGNKNGSGVNGNGIDCYAGGQLTTVNNLECYGNFGAGIYIKQGPNADGEGFATTGKVSVINCISHDNTRSGVAISRNSGDVASEPLMDGVTVIGGRFFGNGDEGIGVRGKNITLQGCYIYNNGTRGVGITQSIGVLMNGLHIAHNNAENNGFNVQIGTSRNVRMNCCNISGVYSEDVTSTEEHDALTKAGKGIQIIVADVDDIVIDESVTFSNLNWGAGNNVYFDGTETVSQKIIVNQCGTWNPGNGLFGGIGSTYRRLNSSNNTILYLKTAVGFVGWTPIIPTGRGETAARPTNVTAGAQFFDTTLKKPIWYNGSAWVDAAGTAV